MQLGLPGSGEIFVIAFVLLYYGVIVVALLKLFGWLVDRRTRELRQRVALLEHEVAELQEEIRKGGGKTRGEPDDSLE